MLPGGGRYWEEPPPDEEEACCCCFPPCFPNKLKKYESGPWRRKENKAGCSSKQKRHRCCSPSPGNPRPTLLLPPMLWNDGGARNDDDVPSSTIPVVATRIQDPVPAFSHFSTPVATSPSAPSPGEVFLNSEDQADMRFIVGIEEWRFPGHSFILGRRQATLRALMRGAEPPVLVDDAPASIKLPKLDPDAFDQMLSFIYTGQVVLTSMKSALGLLEPSQTYHLPEVTAQCLTYVSEHLTSSEVLAVLGHLWRSGQVSPSWPEDIRHDNDNLQNELVFHCFQVVDCHADLVLQTEEFENLEHSVMLEIVKRDTLGVSSELVVFDAIMRWACRTCKKSGKELTADNKTDVLGKALFLVRYLLMSPEEFLRGPMSQGVLPREDKELLFAKLTSANGPASEDALPEHWLGSKIATKRQPPTTPNSALGSASPVCPAPPKNSCPERKKKSMSKKLLNGVGDLVICVIHMLD